MADVTNISGRINSISQEGVAVVASQTLDERKNKKQSVINQENDEALANHGERIGTLEVAVGEGGSVDERIAQSKSEAESDIKGGASEDYDTLKKAEDAIKSEVNAREGAVSDEASARQDAINTAKTEIIGGASTDCNTLGKAEIKISTNAQDIAQLQAAYEALTESDVVIVAPTDTWPVANPQQNTIYRVADRVNPTPQYYEDYMYNGTAMVLMARYNNAIDPRPKKGSQNLVSSGGVFDNMGALDVSELNATENPHTLATYADLSAALATIPSDYQKGGMSVKFVCSSDNKYVQARLMSNEFTTDTTQWAIAEEGVYVENPEFVRVVTDNEDRILYAVKADGDFYFGAGVPQQIIDYVIEHTNATKEELLTLIDTKVDKEEGKSLIDTEYANGVHYIENPEFAEVKVDNEGRILEAIMKDGTKILPAGVKVIGTAEYDGATIKTVENPEFAGVWLDGEDKILFGVEQDGNFLFGCGVPKQVKEYIEQKIEELSLDEYESIVAFIGDYLNNTTLEELLSKKVDGEYVENHEFIEAKTDAEDKILEATEKDGTKLFGGDVKVLGSIDVGGVSYKVVSNPEWLKVVVDSENRIICGIKTDGKFVVYVADFLDDIEAIKSRLKELDAYSVTENPEFMEVELDANDKVLSGRKVDGTKFENNDVELNGNATVGGSLKVDGVIIKNIEDLENRSEITLDSEEKIISYRKNDGTLVENVGIETSEIVTNSLELTEEGMNDFQQALKDAGFQPGGGGNWSDRDIIELPEPKHYSLLNIAVDSLPINDGQVSEGYIEYYDGLGNYFKMECSLEPQGQSSRIFARTGGKGNYTLDLPKDIKFGSWVPQDSFHLKGAAKDVSRGMLATSYKLAYPIQEYLDAQPDRVLVDDSGITVKNSTGARINDWFRDARCLPDGFPVEVYVNGEYWGLYAWQLKKHRKNYSMDKKDYTSFFIDPDRIMTSNYQNGIWNDGPDATIPDTELTWWTGFDIKGPKDLICMDGSAFDGDNPKELIDSTSPVYDSSNKKHKGSQTTKNLIRSFQTKYLEVKALIDNDSIEDAKAAFNANFDYNSCMLVYIYNCLMMNGDSIRKNTLWGIYKSGKIFAALWDLDGMYGQEWTGTWIYNPSAGLFNTYANAAWPLGLFWTLYETEIKAAYSELRRNNIISINSWEDIVFGEWFKKIGQQVFERDLERWPETPSYRENYTNTDYWVEEGVQSGLGSYSVWDGETEYAENDKVLLPMGGNNMYIRYNAVQQNQNKRPVTKFYDGFPQVGGYYDSPKRWQKWMDKQIMLCDVQNDYFEELRADFIAYRSTDPEYEIECTNMTVDTKLSKAYNYIQGHITRHEIEVEGQTVSTYTIDGGAETPEDTSKTYTTVRAAIEAASSQPVDVPSENVYYIQARAKDITYHKK